MKTDKDIILKKSGPFIWSSNSTPRVRSKLSKMLIRWFFAPMIIVALFVIIKICALTDQYKTEAVI